MATSWQLTGTNQIICAVKQAAAAAEAITFDVNDGNAYSVLGGYVTVLATGGGGGTVCTVDIGATEIASVPATAVGTFPLALNSTASNLNGDAGENITITTNGASDKVQVTLFISQAAPDTLA